MALVVKTPTRLPVSMPCKRRKRRRFDPWVRKIPWRRARQPTPASLPGESHGQRNLAGYSPRDHRVGHDWMTNTHRCLKPRLTDKTWNSFSQTPYNYSPCACLSYNLIILMFCPQASVYCYKIIDASDTGPLIAIQGWEPLRSAARAETEGSCEDNSWWLKCLLSALSDLKIQPPNQV